MTTILVESVVSFARNYGLDIVDRLNQAGFKNTEIILVKAPTRWGYNRRVVAARK